MDDKVHSYLASCLAMYIYILVYNASMNVHHIYVAKDIADQYDESIHVM